MHWLLTGFWDVAVALEKGGRWTWACKAGFNQTKWLEKSCIPYQRQEKKNIHMDELFTIRAKNIDLKQKFSFHADFNLLFNV